MTKSKPCPDSNAALAATNLKQSDHLEAYTVKAFCKTYSVGHTFFYGELKSKRLMARKAGKKTLILKSDAEQWAKSLPVMRGAR